MIMNQMQDHQIKEIADSNRSLESTPIEGLKSFSSVLDLPKHERELQAPNVPP